MFREWLRTWWIVAVPVAFFSLCRGISINEGDVFWGARAGVETLAGAPFVRPDTWSWLPLGSWAQNEYGWNIVLGFFYQTFGATGLAAVGVVVAAAALTLFALLAAKLGALPVPTAIATVLFAVFCWMFISSRAIALETVAFPAALLLAPWIARTVRTSPVRIAALFVGLLTVNAVGMNLHLGWLAVAFLIAVAVTSATWWETRSLLGTIGVAVTSLAAAALAPVATPYGWGVWHHILGTADISKKFIEEWQHAWDVPFYLIPVVAGLMACVLLVAVPKARDVLAPLLAACLMGAWAVRFCGLPAAPAFAGLAAWVSTRPSSAAFWASRRTLYSAVIAALTVACTVSSVGLLSHPGRVQRWSMTAAVPSGCRLLASPNYAGAVALFRPDVTVYVDGRNDYWGSRYLDYIHILASTTSDVAAAVATTGATCVVTDADSPDEYVLDAGMAASGTWRAAARDGGMTLWLPTR